MRPGDIRTRSTFIGVPLALLLAVPLCAARRSDNALSLVPADAASVAVIRLNDLRSSPLSAKLFSDTDRLTVDGDAARFLEEAQLRPKEDVDTVVVAATPRSTPGDSLVLALFEGRFDPDRLATAIEARGGARRAAPSGIYFLLPEKKENHEPGAVAFVSRHLVIAGSESAVLDALAKRESGGTTFASGAGLGRHLNRIDRDASVWVLVDVARTSSLHRQRHVSVEWEGNREPGAALFAAMKSVSLFVFEATAHGDALEVSASGLCKDEDTRQLLEDSLRGLVAIWRLAVEEKSPQVVSALRKFKIRSDGEAVSISGTLPGTLLRSLTSSPARQGKEDRDR